MKPLSSTFSSKTSYIVLCLLTLALTIIAYYPGLSGDFVFDDFSNFVLNPQIHITSLSWKSLVEASFSSHSGMLRRPISILTLALNYYFFGIHPYSFKVVNLAIHLANGIALYILTRQLLYVFSHIYRRNLSSQMINWLALAVSAAWLLHPMNLTAVLYIVQRMTSLATLFTIGGLSFYVWGRWRLWNKKSGLALIAIGVVGFGSLAIFSKESGALLPLYMVVIEATLFRFRNIDGKLDKSSVWLFIAIVALPALACLFWLYLSPQRFLGGYAFRNFTATERMLTEARVVVLYLRLIFAPALHQMALYHDDIPISQSLINPPTTLLSVALICALFICAWLVRKKWPLVSFGILWFFTAQVLESTFLPLQIAFEHRNYLGDYGILLPVCYTLLDRDFSPKTLPFRRISVVVLIGLLGVITHLRAEIWSDNVDQAVDEAQYHPDSPQAEYSAGRILANLVLAGHPQYKQRAYRYLERAARLDKDGIMADVGLIIFSAKAGDPIDPAWVKSIQEKLATGPIAPDSVTSLKELRSCQETECKIDNRQMLAVFESALHNPRLPRTPQDYADVQTIFGTFLINKLNNFDAGRIAFERAVEINPREPQYRINLAKLLIVMHRFPEAQKQITILKSLASLYQFSGQISALEASLARESASAAHPATKKPTILLPRHPQSSG